MNQGKSTTKKATQKSAKSTTAIGKTFKGFTDEERVAMKERFQELKGAAARGRARTDLPPEIVPVVKLVPAAGWRITARLVVQGNDIRVSCVV